MATTLAATLALTTITTAGSTSVVEAATPEEAAIRDGLADLADALGGLDNLDELGSLLPISDLLPTSADGLDIVDSLTDVLDTALAALPDPNATALENALNALDGSTLAGGVTVNIDADVSGSSITFDVLKFSRVTTAAVAFADEDAGISLEGASLDANLSYALADNDGAAPDLTIDVDSSGVSPQITIPATAPAAGVSAGLTANLAGQSLDLGILTVTATGSIDVQADFDIAWLDPDNDGQISLEELTTSAPLDLFDVGYGMSSVAMNLALAVDPGSHLSAVPSLTGTITLDDADLSDGLNDPVVSLPELSSFTELGAEQILLAVAQLAVSLQAMQVRVANPSLPMLGAPVDPSAADSVENLADLIDINAAIGQFFIDNGLSTAESPFELRIGDVDGDGTVDIDLDTLGLDTIDEIIDALAAYLGDSADLDYDPGTDAITFDLDFGATYDPPAAEVKLNEQLAEVGIAGLVSANGTAGVAAAGSYAVNLGFGIDLSDLPSDTPITDRLFIDTAGTEITGDASVCADLALMGTLGFVELALADQDTDPDDVCADAGFVPILTRRAAHAGDPMVSIDLDGGSDDMITLSDLFDELASLDVSNSGNNVFTLSGTDAAITGTINAAVPSTTVNATATIGSTDLAGAELTFGWSDILNETPQVSGDATFNDDFLSFNFDSENPLALFNQIIDLVDTAMAAIDNLGAGSILDEELPIIGASPRESLAFLDDVRDKLNEIAQDPAGSLQRLELELELAIAEALGVDVSSVGELPDPNDPSFITDPDAIPGNGDEVFDDAAFQAALTGYLEDLQTFLAANADFLDLSYEPGNSPGAIVLGFNIGVCSDKTGRPDCTHEIPLETAFNFDLDALGGSLSGLIAAEGEGELMLDYGATVRLDVGVELPDVFGGEFVPRPFVKDTSNISLDIAGVFDGAFEASIGPFEVEVGNTDGSVENCANDEDDDGDGAVNDGCPVEGDGSEADIAGACDNAVDDDTTDDDDNGAGSAVNDGCPDVPATVQAKAGAEFVVSASATNGRAYLLPDAGETGLSAYLGDLVASLSSGLSTTDAVDCGNGVRFACASLPLRLGVQGGTPIFLGRIEADVTSLDPFNFNFDPTVIDDIKNNLLANAENLAWQLIGQGLKEFGDYIEDATAGSSYDVDIPVVGDVLDGGAAIGEGFNQNFAQPVGDFLTNNVPTDLDTLADLLKDMLLDTVLGTGADSLLVDTNIASDQTPDGVLDADDIDVVIECGDGTPCDTDGTAPDNTLLDVTDVRVLFSLGDDILPDDAAEIPFDFGFPGLRLMTADGDDPGDEPDGITAAVAWQIDVGFGLSLAEGFYIVTDADDPNDAGDGEISLEVTVDTPDFSADIAFLGVEIDSDNSDTAKPAGRQDAELSLTLEIDLPDDGSGKLGLSNLKNVKAKDFLPTLNADVDLYWRLQTAPEFGGASAGDGSLPTLLATLDVEWSASLGVDGIDLGDLEVSFEDIQLDLGSFIDDFLGPIIDEVQRYTQPLQPVIDIVSAPIPGISQLAELVGEDPVTMLTLFEAINGNDLTMIRTILDLITFFNSLPADSGSLGPIDIGRFDINAARMLDSELPANQKGDLIVFSAPAAGGIGGAIADIGDSSFNSFKSAFDDSLSGSNEPESEEPGFSFPAFEDFGNLFNLLVGEDVTLIRWASGPLKAEFGFSQTFGPIAVGPIPVSVVISGSAAIEGRIAVGYDTKGVRQLVKMLTDDDPSNNSFLSGFGFLFNGLFLDDLNAAGQDVPEIRLTVEFAAGAAIDLVIVSAGVVGGVAATLDLNLHDGGFFDTDPNVAGLQAPPENLDGKLRLDEIASFIFNNPICLFDVSGKLTAFIEIFVEIDLFLFSKRFEFRVVDITLLELENITAELCEPPDPVLATPIGDGVLRLNAGPNAGARNFAPDEPAEKFFVTQLDGDSVQVSAFGYDQVYDNVSKVVGDFGSSGDAADDEDEIRFQSGSIESVAGDGETIEATEVPFVIPTEICGGPGDDKISGGEGPDRYVGDGAQNGAGGGNGWTCQTGEANTDGVDEIGGLGGVDEIWGTGGNDILLGDNGNDVIEGGAGNDQINGGIGADDIDGGPDDDNIKGGADQDPALGGVAADASNDTIDGEGGLDTIDGDFGDDTITGGPENDIIVAGQGADTVDGGPDEDVIFGNEGDDALLAGGTGDDIVLGDVGNDNIRGDAGDDNLIGGDGDDDVEGGPGWDVILGDEGVINRAQDPSSSDFVPDADPGGPAGQLLPLVVLQSSSGAAGDTVLSGDDDPDIIWGQEGADTIEGGGGPDELHGNAGGDTMSGDADDDTMFGDAGTDTMYGDNASASNGCADTADNIRGGTEADVISGNADADSLFGDSGADEIYGDAFTPNEPCDGNDTARGGPGADEVFGNGKDDQLFGDGDADRIVGGSRQAGELDGTDTIAGGQIGDVIIGDNGVIGAGATAADMLVTLRVDAQGAGDIIAGAQGQDRIFGQEGADIVSGGTEDDYLEGNDDDDTLTGDAGDDDIIGGSSAVDGVIDDDRIGDGAADSGETLLSGGPGLDYIAGDNALVSRAFPVPGRAAIELFDVATVGSPASAGTGGGDVIEGDAGPDWILGQQGDDTIHGDFGDSVTGNGSGTEGDDTIEGNDGADTVFGEGGTDDIAGGGSANDGVMDGDRIGNGLIDTGETELLGGEGIDYIAGDNALISRNRDLPGREDVELFDVGVGGSPAPAGTGGGDTIEGDAAGDWLFGQQGNDVIFGDFGVNPSDPGGSEGDDYIEGNDGQDEIYGEGGIDDIAGGGSANDGVIDADRVGTDLLDEGEVIVLGGPGVDYITGDNGLISRNVPSGAAATIILFDVSTTASSAGAGTGGGDVLGGNADEDVIFGQQGDDTIAGDDGGGASSGPEGGDYVEGNDGRDTIYGEGGEDDLIGGGSANDGVIDLDRVGDGLLDAGELIVSGGDGIDAITGDNARILPDIVNTSEEGDVEGLTLGRVRDIVLFDVQNVDAPSVSPLVSGGDVLHGDADDDMIFGQGNGAQQTDPTQPDYQADPADGVDNDRDGRESADPAISTEYDCADAFDNDGDGLVDGDEPDCTAAIDEDGGIGTGWLGDVVFGDGGDDYLEGNHGSDWMFGDADGEPAGEDDMIGGGSANDGVIDTDRLGTGLNDASDVMYGDGEDDVMTGDNARISRVEDGLGDWTRITSADVATPAEGFGPYDQVVRVTVMFDGDAGADAHDDDYLTGDAGNDEMYGQLEDDVVIGNAGDDSLVGDIGQVTANVIGDDPADPVTQFIQSSSPHWEDTIYESGSMWWETVLFAFDTSQGGVGGADTLLGFDGRDTAFGGPGDDVINGDGDGTVEVLHPENPEFTQIVDVDPATVDDDMLFGGDDDDAVWGGRHDDVEMGGHGADYLDVRPRPAGDNGRKGGQFRAFPRDRPAWFTYAMPENFQDVDFIYGGWDHDALQADQAANGPDPGDRLADWVGGYNVYYECPAAYGDFTITRMAQPDSLQFLEQLAEGHGAIGTATEGTSGFRDLAYVFPNQRGQNSNPPHPDHVGHFTCVDLSGL